MSFQIRRAVLRDLDRLTQLFDAYRRFYRQPANVDGAREFLRARFDNEESVVFVAERDGELLGFTQLYPIFTSVGMRRLWLLNDLFVADDARRLGVATALMNAAREHAESTQAAGVLLETGVDNVSAQALYEKLGYRRVETTCFYQLSL